MIYASRRFAGTSSVGTSRRRRRRSLIPILIVFDLERHRQELSKKSTGGKSAARVSLFDPRPPRASKSCLQRTGSKSPVESSSVVRAG